jgi:hypothetical protein
MEKELKNEKTKPKENDFISSEKMHVFCVTPAMWRKLKIEINFGVCWHVFLSHEVHEFSLQNSQREEKASQDE